MIEILYFFLIKRLVKEIVICLVLVLLEIEFIKK